MKSCFESMAEAWRLAGRGPGRMNTGCKCAFFPVGMGYVGGHGVVVLRCRDRSLHGLRALTVGGGGEVRVDTLRALGAARAASRRPRTWLDTWLALNPAWTAGFRGLSLEIRRRVHAGRARRLRIPATSALDGRRGVSPSTSPPHRRFRPVVGTNTSSNFFVWFGRRRAIEAATPPAADSCHCSPGLTRIACLHAGVPCRDGRPAPRLLAGQSARSRGIHPRANS